MSAGHTRHMMLLTEEADAYECIRIWTTIALAKSTVSGGVGGG